MKFNIRLLYLYLFSFIGLLVVVIGSIRLIDLGLKVFVFRGADQYVSYPVPLEKSPEEPVFDEAQWKRQQLEETTRQRQREVSGSIAMILVGLPLYLYHWKQIKTSKA
jgi:hypothetical protein